MDKKDFLGIMQELNVVYGDRKFPLTEQTLNVWNKYLGKCEKEVFEKAKIFHLRGGIDYSKLNFGHKTMLRLLYNSIKNLSEEKQTAEDKAMIETYNKKVNFIDFSSLDDIIHEISL